MGAAPWRVALRAHVAGPRAHHVVTPFVTEMVRLSGMGALLETLVGPALALAIESFSGMSTIVPLYAVVLSVGISAAIGVVFGMYPAARAADLDPITALRHE